MNLYNRIKKNLKESTNGYNPNPMIYSKMINLESFVGDKYNRELFNSDGIDIEVNDLVKDINKKLIGLKYNDKNEFTSDLEYLKYFIKQNKEYFYDAIDLDIISMVDKVINVTKMVKDSDEMDNTFHSLENSAKEINWKEEEKKLLSDITSVKTEALEHFYKVFKEQGKNKFAERVKAVLDKRKGLAESADYPDESDIDHFIERGNTIIPVRVGETDAEVLEHLSSLGILQQVDPSDEEKASGEYIPISTEMNDRTSLSGVKWVKNPNYVKPESGFNESEEQHADEIVVKFKNSKRDRDTYYRMLNAISELEDQNKISREKYDSCIKQLQELYNKRDRGIKEAEGINLDYNRFKNQILNFIEAEDEANFQNYNNGTSLADNICDFLAYKIKDDKLAIKLTKEILKNRKSLSYLNDDLLKEIYDKYIG